MILHVGTTGFSTDRWPGSVYTGRLSTRETLAFYSEHLSTVEINSTFRRLPSPQRIEDWLQSVPASFRFVLKASQSITHFKRLRTAERETDALLGVAESLGERQGPILFQLPTNFAKNTESLDAFLKYVDRRVKVAFEFKHPSWLDDETAECLKSHAAAQVAVEYQPVVRTTDWGYVRLSGDDYSDEQIREWIRRIKPSEWSEAYVIGYGLWFSRSVEVLREIG